MEESGIVVDIKGNRAIIKTERGSSCEKCQSKDFCHTTSGGSETLIEADNPIDAKKGDRVIFQVAAGVLLKTRVVLYLLPLFAFITGVVVGQKFSGHMNPDLASGIFGFLFLTAAFFGIKIYGKFVEEKQGYRPVVKRIINAV